MAAGISTLGLTFAQGSLFDAHGFQASIGTQPVGIQLDVLTRYADGSIKSVVAAINRPSLAAGAEVTVVAHAGPPQSSAPLDLGQALAGHHFVIDSLDAGGAPHRLDLVTAMRAALADGQASFWQAGPLVSQARVEVAGEGSQRIVADITIYADGGWALDLQIANDRAMEAAGGSVTRALHLTMDGADVFTGTIDLGQYQSWHQRFASDDRNGGQGLGDPGHGWLNIRHDIGALEQTGALPHFALSQGVSATLLDAYDAATHAAGWNDPLASHNVTQYMPQTGGRDDIGFTTAPNAAWLISQDPRAAAYALDQAETAGAVPWRAWDEAHHTWLTTDWFPKLWTDPRGGTGQPGNPQATGLAGAPDPRTGWLVDTAHQPDLSFVPFLLTGERWMLDNLQAQAAWDILSVWPTARGGSLDLVVRDNQVRGAAWSLRQIDEAAWASPDGSPEQAYFGAASAANWGWLVAQIPSWTAKQGEAHGWLPGDYGVAGALPPWQQDFFASTALAAARHGNADAATFLDWQANFLVGRFTHAGQGFAMHDGAAYLIAISDTATGQPYGSWSQIGQATRQANWSNGDGWGQSQGYYGQLALATLSGIAEVSRDPAIAAAAARAYEALLADAPPFTTTADFNRDPGFAIAAPTAQPPAPPPPQPGDAAGAQGGPLLVTGGDAADRFAFDLSAGKSTRAWTEAIVNFDLSQGDDVWITRGGTPVANFAWAGSLATHFGALDHDVILPHAGTSGGDLPMWWVPSTAQGGWLVVDENGNGVLEAGEFALRITSDVADPSLICPAASDDGRTLTGTDGQDTLFMRGETLVARGGGGDDTIQGGAGPATMEGGPGDDVYVVHHAGATVIEQPGQGHDTAWFDVSGATLAPNVEVGILFGAATVLSGSTGDDVLVANPTAASALRGGAGRDTLWGSALADTLDGGAGDDIIRGGGGADLMVGGAGDDQFVVGDVGVRLVELPDEGTDSAWVTVNDWTLSAHVEIARLAAAGATRLFGSEGADQLVANQTAGSLLSGNGGDDVLWGSPFADTMLGGAGDDIMRGQGGDDQMAGGAGNDQYVVFSPNARVIEDPGAGYDIVYYVGPGTFVMGNEVEEGRLAEEGQGLIGNASNNLLVGSNLGRGSVLDGQGGDDIIFGTPAADTITGGAGRDTLYSYGGADLFEYTAPDWGVDQVSGFTTGLAKLDFRGSGIGWSDLILVHDGNVSLVVHNVSVIILYDTPALSEHDFLF